MSSILNSILFLLVVSQLSDCHVHKHFKNEKTTVSQFENHQDHAEFDRDALFGSSNEHLNELPPEEAKKRLRRFIEDGKLDRNEDGYITKDELADWVLNSFQSISIQDAQDQLKEEDEDRDGQISWNEHFKNNFNLGAEQTADEKQMIYEDKELFVAADQNQDGYLDVNEFPLFTSPEDFPIMHDVLYRLAMRRKDLDGDGLLSFDEFVRNERGEMPDQSSESYLIDKDKFENDLDRDRDGFLQKEETIQWLIPNQHEIANDEADHLIAACDEDKDGRLTLDEIVKNYEVFLESELTDHGDRLKELHHDEL